MGGRGGVCFHGGGFHGGGGVHVNVNVGYGGGYFHAYPPVLMSPVGVAVIGGFPPRGHAVIEAVVVNPPPPVIAANSPPPPQGQDNSQGGQVPPPEPQQPQGNDQGSPAPQNTAAAPPSAAPPAQQKPGPVAPQAEQKPPAPAPQAAATLAYESMGEKEKTALAQVMLSELHEHGQGRLHVDSDINKRGFGIDGLPGHDIGRNGGDTGRAMAEFKGNVNFPHNADIDKDSFKRLVEAFQKTEGLSDKGITGEIDAKTLDLINAEKDHLHNDKHMRVVPGLIPDSVPGQSGGVAANAASQRQPGAVDASISERVKNALDSYHQKFDQNLNGQGQLKNGAYHPETDKPALVPVHVDTGTNVTPKPVPQDTPSTQRGVT